MNQCQAPQTPRRYPDQRVDSGPAAMSAMSVASLALGAVALATSPLPLINNMSFLFALIGVIFSIIGLVAAARGKRRGKVLAIVGLVLSVVGIVVVLVSQSMYGAILEGATSDLQEIGASAPGAAQDAVASSGTQSSDAQPGYSDMSVGQAAELSNGLSVAVQSVQTGLANYDGSEIVGVSVTYTNGGSKGASFNMFDWKAEDAQGVQRNTTFYSEAKDDLHSGSLAPGGTVSGTIYFAGGVSKVLYYSSALSHDSVASWVVS